MEWAFADVSNWDLKEVAGFPGLVDISRLPTSSLRLLLLLNKAAPGEVGIGVGFDFVILEAAD
jgi:hypothetical protein